MSVEAHSRKLNLQTTLLEHFFEWLFGCQHLKMGLPVTMGGQTYQACLDCGARRRFDTDSWSLQGPYYFYDEF